MTLPYRLQPGGFLADSTQRVIISLNGPDAAKFLHGQCTQDILGLAEGHGVHAFVLTPKGKLIGDLYVLRLGEVFYLVVDRGEVAFLSEHLKKYILMQKVELAGLPELGVFDFIGKGGEHLLSAYLDETDASGLPTRREGRAFLDGRMVVRWDRYGGIDYQLIVPQDRLSPTRDRLRERARVLAVAEWSLEDLEAYRIGQGVPRFKVDFNEENLPQETGFFECLHFNKGCYTGQEIVARLHFRGHVSKCLCHIRFVAPQLSREQVQSLSFEVDGKMLGPMTSVAPGKDAGEWLGFLYLPYRALEAATSVFALADPKIPLTLKKVEIRPSFS